jgi:hypothetical protein
VRRKLGEIHGNIASDSMGRTSQLAQRSWERSPDVYRLPNLQNLEGRSKVPKPMYVMKHPEGGAIWRVVQDMKRVDPTVNWDLAAAEWLKKYGGNAVLGATGLESLRNYLQDVSSGTKK